MHIYLGKTIYYMGKRIGLGFFQDSDRLIFVSKLLLRILEFHLGAEVCV